MLLSFSHLFPIRLGQEVPPNHPFRRGWAGIFNDVRQLEGSRAKLKDSDFVYCHAVNEWPLDPTVGYADLP